MVVGTNGATVWIEGSDTMIDVGTEGAASMAAVSLDESGRACAARAGSLWLRSAAHAPWQEIWADSAWQAPIVSVMVEVGRILALTVDGGVLEGTQRA